MRGELFSHPWTSPPGLSNAPQSTAIRPSQPPINTERMAWALGPRCRLFAHFGSARTLSKFTRLSHSATPVLQSPLPSLAVITSLPFTLSNLFSSFHPSPSPPPHPPKTNQSGSMALTRRRRCLPKCPRPSSDLERVGLCCAPYCLDPFLFSILAYFDISRFLSLDLDSCSRSSLPLFVPLELVHRLSPTAFFPRSVCSPPIHYLLTDRVVCGSHVI